MATIHCIDKDGSRFEVTPGDLSPGFSELGDYYFVAIPEHRLYIDDVALEEEVHHGAAVWVWTPGFYAGEVVAELMNLQDKLIASYRLDVSPQINKLGHESFSRMIGEILAFDPNLLFGTEHAQTQIGIDGSLSNLHLQYSRLRRFGAQLVTALNRVTEKPLTCLRRERTQANANQVKRLDQRTIRKALRDPAALSLLHSNTAPSRAPGEVQFDISTVFNDLDNPANQALAGALIEVIRRNRQVSLAFQAEMNKKERESNTRSALAPRLGRRIEYLESLNRALRRIQRMEPFRSLKNSRLSAAGLNAVSAHPVYARAYRFAWYVLRSGLIGNDNGESLWISPTWEIYERWCYVKIVEQMRQRYPQLEWEVKYPTQRDDCIRWRGSGPGFEVTVWLQVQCSAFGETPHEGFASISGQRFPDITITLQSPKTSRFFIADAKYRVSRQGVLEGMESAHLYRDSLRWNGRRPDCVLLLVPRGGGVPGLENDDYRRTNGVGVVVMGGGDEAVAVINIWEELGTKYEFKGAG